jgi:hypothetical protein
MNCKIAREEIILDLYGELDAAAKASLEAHLEKCRSCAAARTETKRLFALLDEHAPVPAPPLDAEGIWRKVQAGIAKAESGRRLLPFPGWRWAIAGASLALVLVAGIFLGRTWFSPAAVPKTDAGPSFDQALAVHLDDAAPVLIDYIHAVENGKGKKALVEESAVRALLLQNFLLRQALVEQAPAAAELLDDLDLVFKEIVSGGAKASAIRDLIRERNILFRLRILKTNKEMTS